MSNNLHLNITKAAFPDVKITAGVIPFESKEGLQALRSEQRNTHVFKRRVTDTADEILVIALDGTKTIRTQVLTVRRTLPSGRK